MTDDTASFPASEEGAKKPRRRRGGVRHRKTRPDPGKEESHPSLDPAPAPVVMLAPAPPPVPASASVAVTPGPPVRASVEQRLGVFIDFENIALGVRDAQYKKFDINLVLQRLIEKGRIVFKKAYADWTRYSEYKREFHEAAIELIDIPQRAYSGKNSADIRMVVDAMDLASSKGHITTFVICSGDSDFSPLVSKLKENDKAVIGVGVKNSTSDLLISNCDEFIFYEDLVRETRSLPSIENFPEKKRELFRLMLDSLQALVRENYDVIWGSMIKQTMQRKQPYFNESYYGYKSFSELLEDAQRLGLLSMKKDAKSGGYIITP
jgi:uncharacterized LabA/DUF88 family protein